MLFQVAHLPWASVSCLSYVCFVLYNLKTIYFLLEKREPYGSRAAQSAIHSQCTMPALPLFSIICSSLIPGCHIFQLLFSHSGLSFSFCSYSVPCHSFIFVLDSAFDLHTIKI